MDEDGNTRDRYIARDNSATVNRYKFPSVHQTFRVLTFDHFRIKNKKGRGKKETVKKKKTTTIERGKNIPSAAAAMTGVNYVPSDIALGRYFP